MPVLVASTKIMMRTVERQVLTHLRLVLTPPEFLPISHRGA